MWIIFNYLFGWDYIGWQNSADQGIARVRMDYEGNPYYFRYTCSSIIDKIETPEQVVRYIQTGC